MATITVGRPFALGTAQYQGAPVRELPLAESQTCVEGDLAVFSSGLVDVSGNNATSTGVLGISEKTLSTAPDSATLQPITLMLPGYLYAFYASAAAARADIGVAHAPADNAVGALINTAANLTGPNGLVPIGFLGEFPGQFRTDEFIGKNSTSADSAGSVNSPYDAELGGPGDTGPCLLVTPRVGFCILTYG